MKIIMIAILLLLFLSRIKNTSWVLSEARYMAKVQKLVAKNRQAESVGWDERLKKIAIWVTWVVEILLALFYIAVGVTTGNKAADALSLIQAAACYYNMTLAHLGFATTDGELLKHWGWHRFNTVLDYLYYPFVIYLLIR